jgi:hypothetical protein
MPREPDPLEAEGQQLEAEMAAAVREAQRLGRSMTEQEEAAMFKRTAGLRQRIADWAARRLVERRPEVLTHGRPQAAEAAKRGLEEARARLRENEDFRRGCSQCPAATVMSADPGRWITIRCGVEHSVLSSEGDPMSVATFCLGDYRRCPSWRAERESNWSGRRLEVA